MLLVEINMLACAIIILYKYNTNLIRIKVFSDRHVHSIN